MKFVATVLDSDVVSFPEVESFFISGQPRLLKINESDGPIRKRIRVSLVAGKTSAAMVRLSVAEKLPCIQIIQLSTCQIGKNCSGRFFDRCR